MKKQNVFYILSNAKVAAINKKDGSIVWEVSLKKIVSSSLSYGLGQIMLEGDKLFIGSNGTLICLSAKDGALIWKNELKGWGYNFVSMANAGNGAAAASEMQSAAATAVVISTT
jgi:glucose dehydrogenase